MSQQPQKGPVYSVTPCYHHHQCHMVLCQSFGKSSIHCCFSCFCSKYIPLYPLLLKPCFLFSFPSSSIIILFHLKHHQSGLPSSGLCSKLFCFSYLGIYLGDYLYLSQKKIKNRLHKNTNTTEHLY